MADEKPVAAPAPAPVPTPSPAAPVASPAAPAASVEAPAAAAPAPQAAAVELPAAAPASPTPSTVTPEAVPAAAAPAADVSPLSAATSKEPEVKTVETKSADLAVPAPVVPSIKYDDFKLPEGFSVDKEQLGKFTGLLAEIETAATGGKLDHTAVQGLGQKLVDFHLAQIQEGQKRAQAAWDATWTRAKDALIEEFKSAPDIGGNRRDTTLRHCGAALEAYGQQVGKQHETELRSFFNESGIGYNAKMIRFVNWVSRFIVETARPVAAVVPKAPPQIGSARRRQYNSTASPTNGAA